MKRLLLWVLMVILMVAVLLGGAGAVLYGMTGENKLPAEHPVFGGTELVPNGYEWTVPVLGEYLERHFTEPANLTVQKLGDLGDAVPELTLPEWAARSELTLTAPDGTIAVTGDAAGYESYVFSQNGDYDLTLTLYRDHSAEAPGLSSGWYSYHAGFTLKIGRASCRERV